MVENPQSSRNNIVARRVVSYNPQSAFDWEFNANSRADLLHVHPTKIE
jgi:hypothetical protein